MCGRFALVIPKKYQAFVMDLDLSFLNEPGETLLPRYNISPGQMIPVLVQTSETLVVAMHWGYRPHWIPGFDKELINAKSETIDTKSVFRPAFNKNRCLILSSGFYEWKKVGTKKQPYYFFLPEHPVFAFAGIFSSPDPKQPLIGGTAAILTTSPNDLVSTVHDRMPVILTREKARRWIQDTDTESLKTFFAPYPTQEMKAYEVSQIVGNSRIDNEELIQPVDRLL